MKNYQTSAFALDFLKMTDKDRSNKLKLLVSVFKELHENI